MTHHWMGLQRISSLCLPLVHLWAFACLAAHIFLLISILLTLKWRGVIRRSHVALAGCIHSIHVEILAFVGSMHLQIPCRFVHREVSISMSDGLPIRVEPWCVGTCSRGEQSILLGNMPILKEKPELPRFARSPRSWKTNQSDKLGCHYMMYFTV